MNIDYLTELPSEWEPVARVFNALGDSTRQKILLLFEPREALPLKALVDVLPLSRTAVAHHVEVLVRAGVLHPRRQGREVYYSADLPHIMDALNRVSTYIEMNMDAGGSSKNE